ncbi:MAG: IS630 family transposase [Methanobrevibacter sp.]|nr:IS630 family transposase [Methanobrevibacter sp.]
MFLESFISLDCFIKVKEYVACERMDISLPTGHKWLDRWNDEGYEGLYPKYKNCGRPSKLSDEDKEKLDKILEKEDYLNSRKANKILKDEFNVEYAQSNLSILLKGLGFHYTKPYQFYSKRPSDAEEQLKKKLLNMDYDNQILLFLDQTGYQNQCNSGKLWFKPELRKNIIIRNPDKFKINAFGSYSPNGNGILQFKETSKTLDIMTFLCESRKVNLEDKYLIKKFQTLLNNWYFTQKNIVETYENAKYTKGVLRKELLVEKFDDLKNNIKILGNEYEFLLDKYRENIYPFVFSTITNRQNS